MVDRLLQLLQNLFEAPEAQGRADPRRLSLAATALMLEVARADTHRADIELRTIAELAGHAFSLDTTEIHELVTAASQQVEDAHDLYQFTQIINEHCDYAEKKSLIQSMWRVALADGTIAAIEDHIIRRVAGLLHLAHEDFIQAKIAAKSDFTSR